MSMSQLKGIIESHKGEDLSKLKTVVIKLDEHLKNTNAKLASLRHQIRLETNPKSRETYLKKSHTMVWEQQTIRRILEDYNKKLVLLVSTKEAKKEEEEKQRYGTVRNAKLFELFKNNDTESEKSVTSDDNAESINQKESKSENHTIKRKVSGDFNPTVTDAEQFKEKKRKLSTEENTTNCVEDNTTSLITINTQAEALKHLAALQEYAMLNDNFRATGLLVQVEKALKKPANSSDFEL